MKFISFSVLILFIGCQGLAQNQTLPSPIDRGAEPGGVLERPQDRDNSHPLDGVPLHRLVLKIHDRELSKFAFFDYYLPSFFMSKNWYLDPNPFAAECKNQLIANQSVEPVACQNHAEVRIHPSWWNHPHTTDQMRADLLTHEVFISFYLNDEHVNYINAAVETLISKKSSTADVQKKFAQARLPIFPTRKQVREAVQFIRADAKALCQTEIDPGIQSLDPYFQKNFSKIRDPLVARMIVGSFRDLLWTDCSLRVKLCSPELDDAKIEYFVFNGFRDNYPEAFQFDYNSFEPSLCDQSAALAHSLEKITGIK